MFKASHFQGVKFLSWVIEFIKIQALFFEDTGIYQEHGDTVVY